MAAQSMSDEFYSGVSNAVSDIRSTYEEAVWGRAVTEPGDGAHWPQAQEQEASFGSSTHTIDMGPTHDQIGDNANYRLAAMERELNPEWPQAQEQSRNEQQREQDRDVDLDR